jgi:dinuclear metal center YbgI/SA1388 family protein
MGISRETLRVALDRELNIEGFNDYCPNGLQVEGSPTISVVVSGVTACQALLDKAVSLNADAVLVHHGYFWQGEDARVVGMKARRLKTLLDSRMNLFAYHLPLDCHRSLGNNAGLGRALGLSDWEPLDAVDLSFPVFCGALESPNSLQSVAQGLERELGRGVTVVGSPEASVQSVAWCTGGGQRYIDAAADAGVDLYVTGEISEQTVHVARERGISFIAAGHHATERFGARALGQWVAEHFGIEHHFVDIDSPA